MDLDSNMYPDLLVGASGSNQAVLLRARPVVNLEASLTFSTPVSGKIDLGSQDCTTAAGERVTCTHLALCLRYSGQGVGDTLEVDALVSLDTRKQLTSRMFLVGREEDSVWAHRITLTKEEIGRAHV